MKPRFPPYSDKELSDLAKLLSAVLTSLSVDNFKHTFVTGTTSSSANTEKLFAHGFTEPPSIILVVEGNAYIQPNSISATEVDVRSASTSQSFKLWAIR